MRRLLLVTHRSIEQAGGPAARWRAFARYLPEWGWEVDVLNATERVGASEFERHASRAVATRATIMDRLARLSEPAFSLAGARPDSTPLSMLWVPRGALLLRRRIKRSAPDVVLASGPPIAGVIAARVGIRANVPLVVELRDLWAGSPAFDAGGSVLSKVEDWLLRDARRVVACTPEAVSDLCARHPGLDGRVVEIANGFDPEIASIAAANGFNPETTSIAAPHVTGDGRNHDEQGDRPPRTITLLHSGTLTAARPILPLVRALGDARVAGHFRLVLHGYLSPASLAEVELARRESQVPIKVLAPSPWREAVARIAETDVGVIAQARAAGDETAVASKIYEYMALGKPVLCITDGGASEALLCRLKADALCARLDAPETIVAALLRLHRGALSPPGRAVLEPYNRRVLAGRMAALLQDVARGS